MVTKNTPNHVGVVVNLASAATKYNLKDLVDAILANDNQVCPGAVRMAKITAFNGVDGTGENTSDVLIGDGFVSATRWAYNLIAPTDDQPPATREYTGVTNTVDFGSLYAFTAGTNQKLAIELQVY